MLLFVTPLCTQPTYVSNRSQFPRLSTDLLIYISLSFFQCRLHFTMHKVHTPIFYAPTFPMPQRSLKSLEEKYY